MVKTAGEMFEKCIENIPKDLFISVAAVSDWKIKNYNKDKIKKRSTNISFQLTEKVRLFAEAKNLTNQPLRYYQGIKAKTMQLEYYDLSWNVGLKFDF